METPDFYAIFGAIGECFLKCGRVGLLFGMNGLDVRGSRSVSSLSRRSKALVLVVSFDCCVDSVKELVCVQLRDLQVSPGLRGQRSFADYAPSFAWGGCGTAVGGWV